jgi:hypothetical protein
MKKKKTSTAKFLLLLYFRLDDGHEQLGVVKVQGMTGSYLDVFKIGMQ